MVSKITHFPGTANEAARIYLDRRALPVPIPHRSKAPLEKGWQNTRLTQDDVDRNFPPEYPSNIGLLLGEPSDGLIDIDLDAPECVTVAHWFLPQTGWISGRKSKPMSHWWYRVECPPRKASNKLLDPITKESLVELRSTTGQTVVPPSAHPSGEEIVWHQFTQPAHVDLAVLQRGVAMVAASSLLGRYWPQTGSRQGAFLALVGGLARLGLDRDHIHDLVMAVCDLTRDEETSKRLQLIEPTLTKLTSGAPVTGWNTLSNLLTGDGQKIVQTVCKWLSGHFAGVMTFAGETQSGGVQVSPACPPPTSSHSASITPTGTTKPTVIVTREEMDVNNEIIASLAVDPDLFTRTNRLVRVLVEPEDNNCPNKIRFPESPVIVPVSLATLREHQSAYAIYVTERFDEGSRQVEQRRISPPRTLTQAVLDRGVWPGLRPLNAVVDYPFFDPSGRLVCERGYDLKSGILYWPMGDVQIRVPATPSREDARYAVESIQEGLVDFPFAEPHHEAAWFAALLTPLVRFAITGQAPLFLIEANAPGAGKGLLVDLISIILRGGKLPVSTYPSDPNELRKRVTALLLRGSTMTLFDNVSGNLGGQDLEALITSSAWSDRVLGQSSQVDFQVWMTWYATANNVNLIGDMARRICLVRLESPCERPEERNDLKIQNLREWAQKHRDRLLTAAATILKAFYEAGCPDQELPAWGSFEGWSRIVRNALVWAGLADPWAGRKELRERADTEIEAMKTILQHWPLIDPVNRGITTHQVCYFVNQLQAQSSHTTEELELMEAYLSLVHGKPEIQPRLLGAKFRKYQQRNLGGYSLQLGPFLQGSRRWIRNLVKQG